MEKISCGIMQDLLISYSDALTGEGVTQMISKHLEECPTCRKCYEDLKRKQAQEAQESIVREKRFLDKLKSIRYYMIGIFLGMLIPVGMIVLFFVGCWIQNALDAMYYGYYF